MLGTVYHMFRHCMRGKWSLSPVATYRKMTTHDFWDSATPSALPPDARGPEWMIYDDSFVDEVIRGVQACKVFLWYPVFRMYHYFSSPCNAAELTPIGPDLTMNQMNSNLISQAATMETHGLPNDILSNLDPLSLIILIPLFDYFIYPFFQRRRMRLTPLRRITAGFFVASLGMAYTAFVQHRIYATNPCGEYVSTCADDNGRRLTSSVSVWMQTGSYVLISISEVLASVTGLEYAYTKAPKGMRSLVMSVFMFMSAIASVVGELFVGRYSPSIPESWLSHTFSLAALSADPLLVWNYAILSVLATVAGVLFWRQFHDLDAREDELNGIGSARLLSSDHEG